MWRHEERDQSRYPDRRREGMNQQRLLQEILRQRKDDIAPVFANVVHQLDEGPVIVNVPKQVGQKNQEGRKPAQPHPRTEKDAALRRQQKADDQAEPEDRNRILLLQPDSRYNTEPYPIARIVPFDGENSEVSAAHPQIRFKAVGAEKARVREILRCNENGYGAQQ